MTMLRKRVRFYGRLPSATIRDERLSDRALGLLLRIIDLPTNWTVRADVLAAGRPQGRDATAAALRNLAACGYYRVERRRLKNGRFQMGTAVSEETVPQWEAEYNEFDGKPIPLVEQEDGTYRVLRKSGATTDDGFIGEYAPARNLLPMPNTLGSSVPAKTPGQAGNGNPGSGQIPVYDGDVDDLDGWAYQIDKRDGAGHAFPGSGAPDSGLSTAISNREKYDRDVAADAPGVKTELSVEGEEQAEIDLGAVGDLPRRNAHELEAPTAQDGKPIWTNPNQLKRVAWQTATYLPRRYRDGLPRNLAFALANDIAHVMRQGISPHAIIRYAEMCAMDTRYAQDRHVPLFRQAMRLLRADVNTGLVCAVCGHEPSDVFGPPCAGCNRADRTDLTPDELAQLEAAKAFLGATDGATDSGGDSGGDGTAPPGGDGETPPGARPYAPLTGAPDAPQSADPPSPSVTGPAPAYSGVTDDLGDAGDAGVAGDAGGGSEAGGKRRGRARRGGGRGAA